MPLATDSSLQYLSQLSQQITRETKDYLTQTQDYGRSFTYRPQDIPASRVFRERQSRRMFEELKRVKGSCA